MADVFLSYANSDRERARDVANVLSAHGWSVWWDRQIRPGETFDDVIERELETAKNIVVLWTKASVVSEWVRNEAAVAAQRGVLVPVLLEDVKPPLEFRRKQTLDLVAWDGHSPHAGLHALLEALGGERPTLHAVPAPEKASRFAAARSRFWVAAAAMGFVAGGVFVYALVGGASDASKAAGRADPERPSPRRAYPNNLATSYKGVFLDVVGFQKAGELTTLEWTVRNTFDQSILMCGGASEVRLIDQNSGESWRPVHSGGPGASCAYLSGGAQSGAWVKFKVTNHENRRFSLSSPLLHKAPELPPPQVAPN